MTGFDWPSLSNLAYGAVALALFFRLGKVVANHEIRLVQLETKEQDRERNRRPRPRRRH